MKLLLLPYFFFFFFFFLFFFPFACAWFQSSPAFARALHFPSGAYLPPLFAGRHLPSTDPRSPSRTATAVQSRERVRRHELAACDSWCWLVAQLTDYRSAASKLRVFVVQYHPPMQLICTSARSSSFAPWQHACTVRAHTRSTSGTGCTRPQAGNVRAAPAPTSCDTADGPSGTDRRPFGAWLALQRLLD